MNDQIRVRNARPEEFGAVGTLMVEVYSSLDGFPKPEEQPAYYHSLANIGDWTKKPHTELLVAAMPDGQLAGGVLYFGDMTQYGAGGVAVQAPNSSGFRLLAVGHAFRGLGVGKLLTTACIEKARQSGHGQVLIHSTEFMQVAWKMYESLGFGRAGELDFMQGQLPVYGFRLLLK
jgi:GNAT superfamily N-acetyltransferase